MTMRLRSGMHLALEEAANEMLRVSLAEVKSYKDRQDVLTPWKERERYRREVFVPSGTPDPSQRKGIFGRALNTTSPHLNSRDGTARGHRARPVTTTPDLPATLSWDPS